ncbi:Transferring glycosyl group transferase [Heracleum sosnowskyi]|uniref:Transferring glycosyl group transferase n=1 Tax=Heracleum sosnowskyi TaxID=360622 RepID=A0AAD8GP65_9APIA|nr:Transferring glycosyl group transferase [Heracleum sosnowskyi]
MGYSFILKKNNPSFSLPSHSDVVRTRETLQRAKNSTNSSVSISKNEIINASSYLWKNRKEYIKQWWRPGETRGVVWLDQKVSTEGNEGLPEIRISGDTSKFKYINRQGDRSALRISRVVSETLRLGMEDIRWFVMGDDDTVFLVENLVRVLSKYDHNQLYYIGCISESHIQNIVFSYAMAYGGGGFAISYPLAKELEKMHDRCLQRYPGLYGSDDRMKACMAELGVPLTKEDRRVRHRRHGAS